LFICSEKPTYLYKIRIFCTVFIGYIKAKLINVFEFYENFSLLSGKTRL
jgi:hypothetical protein